MIALALRAITDYNIINTLIGSALGMGYAATLIGAGWYCYRRRSPLAPVFAACGAVLMSVIVVETHSRFLALPLVPAYMTLMATGVAALLLPRRARASRFRICILFSSRQTPPARARFDRKPDT